MANEWFVMIPPSYASKSTAEKELVDFVIQYQYGTAAYNEALAGLIVQGAAGNSGNPQVSEQLVKWLGPFATQAQAKAAANPQQQSPNPLNDATNAAENSSLGAPLAQLGNFLGDLTQRNTWLRAAKIVAGFILVAVGTMHLFGVTVSGTASKARALV